MLTEQIEATRGWNQDTIDAPEFWTYSLSDESLSALASEFIQCEGKTVSFQGIEASKSCVTHCLKDISP